MPAGRDLFRRRWGPILGSAAAVAGIPVPLQLPGMVAWYDPTQETAWANGQEVTLMTDWSGNGNNATIEATRDGPTWDEAAGLSGLPAFVTGPGVAVEAININKTARDWTVYCVLFYSTPEALNFQRLLHSTGGGSPLILYVDGEFLGLEWIGTSTNGGATFIGEAVQEWQIITWRLQGGAVPTSNRIQIWRMLEGSGQSNQLLGSSTLYPAGGAAIIRPTYFSQINGGGDYLIANVGDLVIYEQPHGDQDRLRMTNYLADKWQFS